jgi:nucleoside-diphosphate-sugar epimerase
MRTFVAGSSGVIGIRLVPRLVEARHVVAGMTRTPSKVGLLEALGAIPVVCDVFDAEGLRRAVAGFAPDVIVHLLTDLPDEADAIAASAGANARIRREGTRNLIAAAQASGVTRFLAESVAWELGGDAEAAVRELEQAVLDVGGVVLRYGRLYGPGTYDPDTLPEPPRIHIDEAARRTVEALEAPTGIVAITEAT